jgi:hypothetical protein
MQRLTQHPPRCLLGPLLLVNLHPSRQHHPTPTNPNPRLAPILRLRPKRQPLPPRNPLSNLQNLTPPQELLILNPSNNHRRIQPRNKYHRRLHTSSPSSKQQQQQQTLPIPANMVPAPLRSTGSGLLAFSHHQQSKSGYQRLVFLDLENRARNRHLELQARVEGWMDSS